MKLQQHREYQTIRLFAILALMTAMVVILFKVVLFAPQNLDINRQPAQNINSAHQEFKVPAPGSSETK
ncbi:MAG: hypothetical protein ACXVAX_11985 [Pseudobdellovibrio sp.]